MNKLIKAIKNLPYEELVAVLYFLIAFALLSPDKGLAGTLVFYLGVTLFICSSALIVSKKTLAPILWPLLLAVGVMPGTIVLGFGGSSGGTAAVAKALFAVSILISLYYIVLSLFFARKDLTKILILFVFATAFAWGLDATFIAPWEIGEKGSDYYLDEYADWRVLID